MQPQTQNQTVPAENIPAPTMEARPPLPVPKKLQETTGEQGVVDCYEGPFHRIVFKGAGIPGYNEGRYVDDPKRPNKEAHRLQNRRIIDHALFGKDGGKWTGP